MSKEETSEEKKFENDAFAMNKYSRQVGEFGLAAMSKLVQMKVLIIGLDGVGIEVAKNLILSGVGSVSLYHEDMVKIKDLGTNFYLAEEDVGKRSVADASLAQLKSLNPLVKVSVFTGHLKNTHLKQFTFVVDCGLTYKESLLCNKHCRSKGKGENTKFIRSRVHGLMGYVFNDFGEHAKCVDKTGERPVVRLINKIESDPEDENALILRLLADKRHNIDFDGHVNFINFEEVEGDLGKALNNTKDPFEVQEMQRLNKAGKNVFDPYSLKLKLGKETKLKDINYEGAGQITQVKRAVHVKYDSLETSLGNPIPEGEFMLPFTDGTKFGRGSQLHFALHGLWKYETLHKKLPPANNEAAIAEIINLAKEVNNEMKKAGKFHVEELEEDVISKVARFAACQFQPLCAFFGGVVAQEVIKHTGKYTPLRQWLHIDAFEALPEEFVDAENPDRITVEDEERSPLGSRYDDMLQIFGKGFHDKLRNSSTFLVGCGALGCELLKNFSLIGLACGDGKITVTDNDTIELSNLSRQFLFREENVGDAKSIAAGAAVKKMNKEINVESLKKLVCPETEETFNQKFWLKQDFITNALDNVTAREYVDEQCVMYSKALLESGTLGTKCNSQVIIPHKTASYKDGPKDDAEDAIPMCTVRNFPTNIEHCIKWARARFTDIFEADSTKASKFMEDPDMFIADLKKNVTNLSAAAKEVPSLRNVVKILTLASSGDTSFNTCVEEAWKEFHVVFRDKILALIKAKPEDTVDEDGSNFWGNGRRFPAATDFDANNELHLKFILSMANILSLTFGLVKDMRDFERSEEKVKAIIATLEPPPIELEEVNLSEEENVKTGDDEMAQFSELLVELKKLVDGQNFNNISIEPASFEKDDDANCHIDYITATSNLRATNYRLKTASAHECKMIAGKIIPAIATTTSAVCGLVCIELLKLIQPGKKMEAFKDSSDSLGVNQYIFMEPGPPVAEEPSHDLIRMVDVNCLPEKFNKWDKTVIDGEGKDISLGDFLEAFKKKMKEENDKEVHISWLAHKNFTTQGLKGFGATLFEEEDNEEYLTRGLKDIMTELYGQNVVSGEFVQLDASVDDDDLQAYKIPALVYKF